MTTTAYNLRKAMAVNSTAAGLTAKVPRTTAPDGVGAHNLFSERLGYAVPLTVCSPDSVVIQPFGTDANNETALMAVYGWSKVEGEALYIPQLLVLATVTLGNIAQGTANTFMADTIVVTANHSEADTSRTFNITNAADYPASIELHMRGCQWIEFDFGLNTSSASVNAYWRPIHHK